MANTWRPGEFGLSSFDFHNISFDSLIQHFNDDINGNYDDYPLPTDPTYGDVPIPSDSSFTNVSRTIYTFSAVPLPSDATYGDVALPTDPTYNDLIKNT
tara:strand:- start:509 stop:805 length:297 start_codon:yes stop_codon:yes gene_type:complete